LTAEAGWRRLRFRQVNRVNTFDCHRRERLRYAGHGLRTQSDRAGRARL